MNARATAILLIGGVLLAGVPLLVNTNYVIHVLITIGMFLVLALGFDLITGRVGLLFLAPATFFGIGTYTVALLHEHADLTLWLPIALAAGGVAAASVAVLSSIPLLRLSSHTFAMATLAFALVAELVVNNWVEVTMGPMCIGGISRPILSVGGVGPEIASVTDYYYVMLVIALLSIAAYIQIVTSRVGRSFDAIRQSDTLAASLGIPVQRYKRAAFVMAGASAGLIGVFSAHYTRVVCPSDLSVYYVTLNLLVILYVGGARSLWGILAGSAVILIVPELLRVTPDARMALYGLMLLGVVILAPGVSPVGLLAF